MLSPIDFLPPARQLRAIAPSLCVVAKPEVSSSTPYPGCRIFRHVVDPMDDFGKASGEFFFGRRAVSLELLLYLSAEVNCESWKVTCLALLHAYIAFS